MTGHSVSQVDVRDRRLLSSATEKRLRTTVCGQRWVAIGRKGKYLTVELANGWELIFHMRMTGQLVLETANGVAEIGILDKPSSAHYRLKFDFDHGVSLAFYDQRRFGEVFLRRTEGAWPGKPNSGAGSL